MAATDITTRPTQAPSHWYDFLKKDTGQGFGLDNLSTTAKVLGGSLGAYGLASALGKAGGINEFLGIGGGDQKSVGYQGGIPQYTASRQVLAPPVGEGGPSTADRRPGSGGRRYFTDMTYTPTGDILGGRPVNTGTYMPEDQVAALLAALSEQSVADKTPTAPPPARPLPADPLRPPVPFPVTPAPPATLGPGTTTPTLIRENSAYAPATAETGFMTPNVPAGPGGQDPYIALREAIQQAGATTDPDGRRVSSDEARQIFDMAKLLEFSVPQLTEQVNNYINGLPTSLGSYSNTDIANAIKSIATPEEASKYFGLYTNQNYAKGGLASLARSDNYAGGGLASLPNSRGYYLGGPTDGMADKIPANIDGRQPAALSDGEFVVPADVVSHFGNGNSDAGAKVLYDMMDRVRKARTGTPKQGRQINPNNYTPA